MTTSRIVLKYEATKLEKLEKLAMVNNLTKEKFLKQIIKKNLKNTIYFRDGITYNKSCRKFLKFDKEILLTKTELKLLEILLKEPDEFVRFEVITKKLSTRNSSIHSLRNFIRSIRLKTYHSIIETKSGLGYKIKIIDS